MFFDSRFTRRMVFDATQPQLSGIANSPPQLIPVGQLVCYQIVGERFPSTAEAIVEYKDSSICPSSTEEVR
jgi:hypothetical protein